MRCVIVVSRGCTTTPATGVACAGVVARCWRRRRYRRVRPRAWGPICGASVVWVPARVTWRTLEPARRTQLGTRTLVRRMCRAGRPPAADPPLVVTPPSDWGVRPPPSSERATQAPRGKRQAEAQTRRVRGGSLSIQVGVLPASLRGPLGRFLDRCCPLAHLCGLPVKSYAECLCERMLAGHMACAARLTSRLGSRCSPQGRVHPAPAPRDTQCPGGVHRLRGGTWKTSSSTRSGKTTSTDILDD